MTPPFFVDIACCQGNIDMQKIKDAGAAFVVIKATEGTGYVDPCFYRNWQEATRVGLRKGPYHFFHPELDPAAQARFHHDVVGVVSALDFPHVLDFETTHGLTSAHLVAAGEVYKQTLERYTGRLMPLYTGAYVLGDTPSKVLSTSPLWLAQYTPTIRKIPSQWAKATCWQYSGNGGQRLPGVNVDVDRDYYLGDDDIATFIRKSNLHDATYAPRTGRGVQRALQQLGYDIGNIDGVYGPRTYAALNAFLRDQSLPEMHIPFMTVNDELSRALGTALVIHGESWMRLDQHDVVDAHTINNDHVMASQMLGHTLTNDGMSAGVYEEEAA